MMQTPVSGAPAAVFRSRYFNGKYMTARDFATDPEYFLDRHRLHDRLLHGWGVLEGLTVVPHPNVECRDRWVRVEPGIALDRLGREIVLAEPVAVEVVPKGAADGPFVVFATYGEEEVEPVPSLYAEGAADPGSREANRLREVPVFQVALLAEVTAEEWPAAEGNRANQVNQAMAGPPARVALAAVSRPGKEASPQDLVIDLSGRRRLRTALTWVAGLSWTHGGTAKLANLQTGLKVRFTRPLAPPGQDGTGIGPWTFRVVSSREPEELPVPVPGRIETAEGGAAAVFRIDPEALNGLAGRTLLVTLRCDFLLDAEGVPIDGGHLGGRLPGGRGVPGGSFESWFQVAAASKTQEENHGGQ